MTQKLIIEEPHLAMDVKRDEFKKKHRVMQFSN
jgi:hypothetical protein